MEGRTLMSDYVRERLRRPPNHGSSVVPLSTPVVAFGNPGSARVATLGLNPSRQEFLDTFGRELDGRQRRFETLASLRVSGLASASDDVLSMVLTACNQYFKRNPYRTWFDQLDEILRVIGASYYDGTACHLDLVQWATDPTWNGLPPAVRRRLLAED